MFTLIGKSEFGRINGLYQILETLLTQYPHLMLECCGGGGNRIDLGSLKRTHTCWCSDTMSHPHLYHAMLLNANILLPSNYLGSSLGWPLFERLKNRPDVVRHPDAGLHDLSFISRMAGMPFLHGRIADWSDDSRSHARHWTGVYKKIRHLLMKDYYRTLPQPHSEADWDAGQFCDGTAEGLVFVFRWAGVTDNRKLVLHSLDASKSYLFRDEGSGKEVVYSGDVLITEGLPVNLPSNSAKLYSYCTE